MKLVITLTKTVAGQAEAQTLTNQLKALIVSVPDIEIQAETRDDVSTE